MVTNAELIFWAICAILTLAIVVAATIYIKYREQKDIDDMFDYIDENIDDMEDTDY